MLKKLIKEIKHRWYVHRNKDEWNRIYEALHDHETQSPSLDPISPLARLLEGNKTVQLREYESDSSGWREVVRIEPDDIKEFAKKLYAEYSPEPVGYPAIDPETTVCVKKLNPMAEADHWGYYDGTMPIVFAYHAAHKHFIEVSFDRTTMMWFSELLNLHIPEDAFLGWIPCFQVLPSIANIQIES